MRVRQMVSIGFLWGLTVFCLILGMFYVLFQEPLIERVLAPESMWMGIELLLIFVLTFFILSLGGGMKKTVGLLVIVSGFTWLHQSFLPMVVTFLYLIYLIVLGKTVRQWMDGGKKRGGIEDVFTSFFLGSCLLIGVVCILSVLQLGGISNIRFFVVVSGIGLCIVNGKRKHKRWVLEDRVWPFSWRIFLAFIVAMVALQVGRMNIAMDYDSLHYGLRTPYILNAGSGIYENLGNINLVYTYSKGLETLVMPLAESVSYGYVLFFNVWVMILTLLLVGYVVTRMTNVTYGIFAAALLSCIPGVMNMSITAKTDLITLLFQLLILFYTMRFFEESSLRKKTRYFVLAGASCLLSFTFKPTALVFSTVVYGIGFLCMLWQVRGRLVLKTRWWLHGLLSGGVLIGIWARTVFLMGVPVTSVFTSIFQLFGFEVKPPFAFASIPNNGSELGFLEGMAFWMNRVLKTAIAPIGADMGHVIIAWATPLVFILILVVLFCVKKRERKYLYVSWFFVLGVSLVSIRILWQVDGNYFMLLYALTVILAVGGIYGMKERGYQTSILLSLYPLMIFGAVICSVTNWSGSTGFSPMKLFHNGYYNHYEENYEKKVASGNEGIWSVLEQDPTTRVLAVGEHPEVLSFPCNVQSYYDLTGSGGNVVLVKTLDNFKGFLEYAKTEYVYVEAGYLEPGQRVYDVIRYMIEDGSLTDVIYENGNLLGKVDLGVLTSEEIQPAIYEFMEKYEMKH